MIVLVVVVVVVVSVVWCGVIWCSVFVCGGSGSRRGRSRGGGSCCSSGRVLL